MTSVRHLLRSGSGQFSKNSGPLSELAAEFRVVILIIKMTFRRKTPIRVNEPQLMYSYSQSWSPPREELEAARVHPLNLRGSTAQSK